MRLAAVLAVSLLLQLAYGATLERVDDTIQRHHHHRHHHHVGAHRGQTRALSPSSTEDNLQFSRERVGVGKVKLLGANAPKCRIESIANAIAPGTSNFNPYTHTPAGLQVLQNKHDTCYVVSTISGTSANNAQAVSNLIKKLAEEGFRSNNRNADQSIAQANERLGFVVGGNFRLELPTNANDQMNFQTNYDGQITNLDNLFDFMTNGAGGLAAGQIAATSNNAPIDIHMAGIGQAWVPDFVADAQGYAGQEGANIVLAGNAHLTWAQTIATLQYDAGRNQQQRVYHVAGDYSMTTNLRSNAPTQREYKRKFVPYGQLRNWVKNSAEMTAVVQSMLQNSCTDVFLFSIDADSHSFLSGTDGIFTRYDALIGNHNNLIYASGGIHAAYRNPQNTVDEEVVATVVAIDNEVKGAMAAFVSGAAFLPYEPNFILLADTTTQRYFMEDFDVGLPEGKGIKAALLAAGGRLDVSAAGGQGQAAWLTARAQWCSGCFIETETPVRWVEAMNVITTTTGGGWNAGHLVPWKMDDLVDYMGIEQVTATSAQASSTMSIFVEEVLKAGLGAQAGRFLARPGLANLAKSVSVKTHLGGAACANQYWETDLVADLDTANNVYAGWHGNQVGAYQAFPAWANAQNPNPTLNQAVDTLWASAMTQAQYNHLGDMKAAVRSAMAAGQLKLAQLWEPVYDAANQGSLQATTCTTKDW